MSNKKKNNVRVPNAGDNKLNKSQIDVDETFEIETEADEEKRQERYNAYVKSVTPTYNLPLNMFKAFLIGGCICLVGQIITNIGLNQGLDQKTASTWTSLILVLLSALLTGLNLYPPLAQFGGAGALVPITGFANGVAASAIEQKAEGQVFGVGCSIFQIAGPVILYGIFTSWILGIIYLILKTMGVV